MVLRPLSWKARRLWETAAPLLLLPCYVCGRVENPVVKTVVILFYFIGTQTSSEAYGKAEGLGCVVKWVVSRVKVQSKKQ